MSDDARPFAHTERHLARLTEHHGRAKAEHYGVDWGTAHFTGFAPLDGFVAGFYGLARGAVYVECPDMGTERPFMFATQVAGHRTHVAVCREYADVAYPAWMDHQRVLAVGDAVRLVRKGLADVREWLLGPIAGAPA